MTITEMIKRSFEIRATDPVKREVSGIAVPYNEAYDMGNGKSERFQKGAVDTAAHVKLFRDHQDIIGVVTEMRDETDGLHITAKISDTVLGNETLALVQDGAIRSFSVGFIPVENKIDGNRFFLMTQFITFKNIKHFYFLKKRRTFFLNKFFYFKIFN